jgi:aromatic ring hydroxylase
MQYLHAEWLNRSVVAYAPSINKFQQEDFRGNMDTYLRGMRRVMAPAHLHMFPASSREPVSTDQQLYGSHSVRYLLFTENRVSY